MFLRIKLYPAFTKAEKVWINFFATEKTLTVIKVSDGISLKTVAIDAHRHWEPNHLWVINRVFGLKRALNLSNPALLIFIDADCIQVAMLLIIQKNGGMLETQQPWHIVLNSI